ncbi:MAG: Eco57I restriction-modification methylase domain-containing protein [Salinivirgaceae bacterium]|nr:Eco57I restriction-modification methylase domain-containing protein [Salinivirgaceae bacterium]
MASIEFENVSSWHIIYLYTIDDEQHKDLVKVGKTSTNELDPTDDDIKNAAIVCIRGQLSRAGMSYKDFYAEKAICRDKDGSIINFWDYDVHDVLERSGIKNKKFKGSSGREWYECSMETAKAAIKAVKEGRQSLNDNEIRADVKPIVFREEQRRAIDQTKKAFVNHQEMLWNAKMRFGKTVSALQVVKEMKFNRTLIVTHRPVVIDGWFKDFGWIFHDCTNFQFGSKKDYGSDYNKCESDLKKKGINYVFFASIQDLRGSDKVGGNYEKNTELFSTKWDLLIVDEAHEGTLTALGDNVLSELIKTKTKVLKLSGTPYNLIDKFDKEATFTWDYVMEQRAKVNWENEHHGEPNPYACLPSMCIYTYDLPALMNPSIEADSMSFNFREFFKTDGDFDDKFVHEDSVKAFLDLLVENDANSTYPFCTDRFINTFRHTLWMLPGVKAAKAMSKLLKSHKTFNQYEILNVAGNGDEDEENEEALQKVKNAIGNNPLTSKTITLSCGRLTTGVSVPAWTGVLMLAGTATTSASGYMQTIFRVQTPCNLGGMQKEQCFVFDFAPDRTLQVLADVAHIESVGKGTTESQRQTLTQFLNFCPVISLNGSTMQEYNVDSLFTKLKRVFIERVVQSGFEDEHIFNQKSLQGLSGSELKMFDKLHSIIGSTKAMPKTKNIDINKKGLTEEEQELVSEIENKKRGGKKLTKEEQELLERHKAELEQMHAAASILRGIAIRMPLMIFGANVKEGEEEKEFTIDNFDNLVDDESWKEFMPKDVSKKLFRDFKKYFDKDIFTAASRRIRELTKEADSMSIEERMEQIHTIFNYFRNPDKETVLTPPRVVNMHMSNTLGGYCFYDEDFEEMLTKDPCFVNHSEVTKQVFSAQSQILEINSKSGLYPLYAAYSIYRSRCSIAREKNQKLTLAQQQTIWDTVLAENIFVLCKIPMAEFITKRTLGGFRKVAFNVAYYKNLLVEIKNSPDKLIKALSNSKTYKSAKNNSNMIFDAIIGNPPYQENDGSGAAGDAAMPIYNKFVDLALLLKPTYITIIMPSKWMIGGRGLDKFRTSMVEDHHLAKFFDYEDDSYIFPNTHIDGGICYFLWDKKHNDKMQYSYRTKDGDVINTVRFLNNDTSSFIIRDFRRQSIIEKVTKRASFKEIVSSSRPFGIRKDLFNSPERYPDSRLSEKMFENAIQIHGVKGVKGGARRQLGFINSSVITQNVQWIPLYKLFFTTTYSTGAINFPEIIVADSNVVCTETFLVIGPFNTKLEQQNCLKYTKTSFFKTLLFFGKGSMQVTQEVFCYVPLQDFTSNSDIDWSLSVEEIDNQLYKKYNLTNDEIAFIDVLINPKE